MGLQCDYENHILDKVVKLLCEQIIFNAKPEILCKNGIHSLHYVLGSFFLLPSILLLLSAIKIPLAFVLNAERDSRMK